MHDLMIIAIPTVVMLFGIFFNNNSAKDLRSEMKYVRAEMKEFRYDFTILTIESA
jgi:hypothetical protein